MAVSAWHDRQIRPGDEWDRVINENLRSADVILLLISPGFLSSKYCRDIEVRHALQRAEKREALLIPLIVKPCQWFAETFAKFEPLPKSGRPLVEWVEAGFARC
jgi:hypothetical protein